MSSPIFQPVIVLLAWTMVIWFWMYATRLPAMQKAKIDVANLVGSTGNSLDAILPPNVQYKAHNYNHLLAEPMLFYVTAIILHIIGYGDGMNYYLACAYVGLRILHSLIQVTVNRVALRFVVFASSSLVLMALIIHAGVAIFHS